ncbi:hypothetical protein [Nocardioides sp.]|uniref:hypothetical protein n=1 Tax=Nocardioides sp. TaxID=35761 RepID=UPI00271CCE4D|nr:hypothetical protein [Nocardioides sp.]MDO9455875.1 hypothetical protein [Nocardioides sp.]
MSAQPRRMSGAAKIAGAVLAAAVLVPTASTAAGNLVTISDPSNANAAKVSDLGRLQVENVNTTDLLFRTPAGAVSFPAGTTKSLGTVSTAGYEKIRVVANNRTGSASKITFRVTILEGNELVAQLATFTLAPRGQRTFVLDVPARAIALYAAAALGHGNVATDVLVYGAR